MGAFDNFFAYSLAGGTAIAPDNSTNSTLIPQWDETTKGAGLVLSNNNLTVTTSGSSSNSVKSNIAIEGKRYWEITIGNSSGIGNQLYGICPTDLSSSQAPGSEGTGYSYYPYNGGKYANGNGGSGGESYGDSAVAGDIIGVAFDADNGTLEFFKNGTSLGVAFTSIPSNTYFAAVGHDGSNNTHSSTVAFDNFAYTPPSGFTEIG